MDESAQGIATAALTLQSCSRRSFTRVSCLARTPWASLTAAWRQLRMPPRRQSCCDPRPWLDGGIGRPRTSANWQEPANLAHGGDRRADATAISQAAKLAEEEPAFQRAGVPENGQCAAEQAAGMSRYSDGREAGEGARRPTGQKSATRCYRVSATSRARQPPGSSLIENCANSKCQLPLAIGLA
jgi:hypothetical protein